jgi:hypothetical protein
MSPNADNAAHVVQLALTPAFLLTGIASLLNVFTQRLARISDQVSRLAAQPTQRPRQLARLRLRSRLLDAAVLLAAIAGALTCCAALTLFLRALRSGGGGTVLFALFGGALVCAVAALAAFAAEMGLAGRTVREMVNAEDPTAPPPQV